MRILLSILFMCCLVPVYGQPIDSFKMIYDVLAQRDTSTIYSKSLELRTQGLYFEENKQRSFKPLRKYIKKHPDPQVEILAPLFINLIYSYEDQKKVNLQEVENVIKQTMLHDDKNISANVFWLVGRTYDNLEDYEKAITYFYAASKSFKEIPNNRFTSADYIDFELAQLLFRNNNDRGAIEYGLKCLKDIDNPRSMYKHMEKVILLDLLGSAYSKINMPDSSLFYYEELLLNLEKNAELYSEKQVDFWSCVAKGNIGENYFNLGRYEEAEPLILTYYDDIFWFKDTLHIQLAQNVYAQLLSLRGEKRKAINLWEAIVDGTLANPSNNLREVVYENLFTTFREIGVMDSAFLYYDNYSSIKAQNEREDLIYGLNRIKQDYAFDELSNRTFFLNSRIAYLKKLRIYTIIIIVLVSLITILLIYLKRKSLKQELMTHRFKRLINQKELQIIEEKTQDLKNKLLEKNKLARSLIAKIRTMEQSHDMNSLIDEIKSYTLTTEDGWRDFRTVFLETHPHMLYNLSKKYANLSPAEQRLTFLLYLNLDNAEIARLLGISTSSVSKSKYRLRQSFGMKSIEELMEFIESL